MRTFVLSGDGPAQSLWAFLRGCWKAQAESGHPLKVTVEPYQQRRTLEQNAKFHSICHELATTRQWAGQWLTTEEWKRLLVAAWQRAAKEPMKILPALDGQGFDVVYAPTSTLGVRKMGELIEYAEAYLMTGEV